MINSEKEGIYDILNPYNKKKEDWVLGVLRNKLLVLYILHQIEAVEKVGWRNVRHYLSCEPPDTSKFLKPILKNALRDIFPDVNSLWEIFYCGKKHGRGYLVYFLGDIIIHRVWVHFNNYLTAHPEARNFEDEKLLSCLKIKFDIEMGVALKKATENPCTLKKPCKICLERKQTLKELNKLGKS